MLVETTARLFKGAKCRNVYITPGASRSDAPGAPATPRGDVIGGRQNVIKIWDNFARLTA